MIDSNELQAEIGKRIDNGRENVIPSRLLAFFARYSGQLSLIHHPPRWRAGTLLFLSVFISSTIGEVLLGANSLFRMAELVAASLIGTLVIVGIDYYYGVLLSELREIVIAIPSKVAGQRKVLDWFSSMFSVRNQAIYASFLILFSIIIYIANSSTPVGLGTSISLLFLFFAGSQLFYWGFRSPYLIRILSGEDFLIYSVDPARSQVVVDLRKLLRRMLLGGSLLVFIFFLLFFVMDSLFEASITARVVFWAWYILGFCSMIYIFFYSRLFFSRIVYRAHERLLNLIRTKIDQRLELIMSSHGDPIGDLGGYTNLYQLIINRRRTGIGITANEGISLFITVMPPIIAIFVG